MRLRGGTAVELPGKLAERIGGIKLGTGVPAAAPVEEDAVDRLGPGCERPDQRGSDGAVVFASCDAEAPEHRRDQRLVEPVAPAGERLGQRRSIGDQRQAAGKLREIPVDRLGLPPETVEAVMVEVGGGEVRIPLRREAPRAIVEAL